MSQKFKHAQILQPKLERAQQTPKIFSGTTFLWRVAKFFFKKPNVSQKVCTRKCFWSLLSTFRFWLENLCTLEFLRHMTKHVAKNCFKNKMFHKKFVPKNVFGVSSVCSSFGWRICACLTFGNTFCHTTFFSNFFSLDSFWTRTDFDYGKRWAIFLFISLKIFIFVFGSTLKLKKLKLKITSKKTAFLHGQYRKFLMNARFHFRYFTDLSKKVSNFFFVLDGSLIIKFLHFAKL